MTAALDTTRFTWCEEHAVDRSLCGCPAPGVTWLPTDVAQVMRGLKDGTYEPITPTVGTIVGSQKALFYKGFVNGLAGESGSGKTFVALVAAQEELHAREHVIFVDLEGNPAVIAERITTLGVPEDLVAEYFHYIRPDEPYGPSAAEIVALLLDQLRPSLVVIDSTGEAMSMDGVDPNKDEQVAMWFRRMPAKIAAAGPAVTLVDHTPKAAGAHNYAIGSQRKRAAISGAQYILEAKVGFSKNKSGLAAIRCVKDRHGTHTPGTVVANFEVTAGESMKIVAVPERVADNPFRPTSIMEKVSRLLEVSPEPLSTSVVVKEVGSKKQHVLTALSVLLDEGYISSRSGSRGANLYSSVRVYRQSDDSTCSHDLFPKKGNRGTGQDGVIAAVPGTGGNRSGTGQDAEVIDLWDRDSRGER